ncbi:glycosyltransferase family 4 protein [Ornithinimicrobium sp. Arc0846-15]|nr:glycosyltransferase family 4 protein [Ornithinimicrobium laminariae]
MRVVLVSDVYLPRLGGIETQVSGLAVQLARAGHQVVVLTATAAGEVVGGDRPISGVTVRRLTPPIPLPAPINPWAGPDLDRLLAQADVVHAHLGVMAPFAAMAISRALAADLPTVITWHSMVGESVSALRARSWRAWVAAGALPSTVSGPAAEQLQAVLGAEVEVIPNGVDAAQWSNMTRDVVPDRPPHLVSAQRFATRKRPWGLIQAVEQARAQLPSVRKPTLEIAGDGHLLGAMRAWVASRGWDWVSLPGRLDQPELADLYARSDLYLNSSRKESFGIAAAEALASGLPVLGYANTGVADIVADGHGWLAGNDADFVARLRWIVERPDRLESARPPAAGERFTDWPAVVARTIALYRAAGAAP